ncbi:MAG: DUF2786 domain-containing protein [Actinomycetota bacterium]|nr:DUF2786 domain-containing protein [Actinomycetota bacterium]
MADRQLDRIAALLAKAESTDSEHEAAALMERAQMLASRDSIDLAVARNHRAKAERLAVLMQRVTTLGAPRQRGLRNLVKLYLGIAQANDVKVNIAHNSTYVIAFGFDSDIDVVDAMFASLSVQMAGACANYLRSGEYRIDDPEVHGSTARSNFCAAFADRISRRLTETRQRAEQEAIATTADVPVGGPAPAVASVEIALREKAVEVTNFYGANSTARGSWRGGRVQTAWLSSAREAGQTAGDRARLGDERRIGEHRAQVNA